MLMIHLWSLGWLKFMILEVGKQLKTQSQNGAQWKNTETHLDQRDLALNVEVGPLSLEVSMFLSAALRAVGICWASSALLKDSSQTKKTWTERGATSPIEFWKTAGSCKVKGKDLCVCSNSSPVASEQKPHHPHQRQDVHQPSLERQPADICRPWFCWGNCNDTQRFYWSGLMVLKTWSGILVSNANASNQWCCSVTQKVLRSHLQHITTHHNTSRITTVFSARPCVHLANLSGCAPPRPLVSTIGSYRFELLPFSSCKTGSISKASSHFSHLKSDIYGGDPALPLFPAWSGSSFPVHRSCGIATA